ncbi:hypothetical protein F4821DRAFT_129009 [Hypoxylon rubiginosum]|uniref:Uncharacterized protein n=1 Tax=Hypoxylon rubiginosum TaxID=110542 RepID=A0ACC0D0N7_9PEZI|nr:hypothetical protein F4821DRAFT_129009 [Hypoxylon rubiginosum]
MDSLPTEVLRNICSCLMRHDAKNFRLVCKAYSAIGAQFALPTNLFAYMTNQDLERLVECSKSEHLARSLLSLEYAPITLASPAVSKQVFKETAKWFYEDGWPRPAGGYSRYKTLITEQESIVTERKDYQSFRSALPHFSQLRHLTVHCGTYWALQWLGGHSEEMLQEFRYDQALINPQAGIRHLETLLLALSDTQVCPESLKINHINWHFFNRVDAQCRTLFQPAANVKHLRFSIDGKAVYGNEDVASCSNLMRTGVLRDYLSILTNLRHLAIKFDYSEACDSSFERALGYDSRLVVPLTKMIPSEPACAHLTSLSLGAIVCERQDMMQVLLGHKETLRELCLQDIFLGSTSWIPLLDAMRKELLLTRPYIRWTIAGRWEGGDRDGQSQLWHLHPHIPVFVARAIGDEGAVEHEDENLQNLVNRYILDGGRAYPEMANPLTENNASRR